jgi:hypothetical protein
MDSEPRPAPRYAFIAEAEVAEIISGTKLGARTSDVSSSGCYLDTLNPSPKDSEIQIRIFHANGTFTALGRVVFVVPNMGMQSFSRQLMIVSWRFCKDGSQS